METQKRQLTNRGEDEAEVKSDNAGSELQSRLSGVTEDRANRGHADTAATQETAQMQPEERHKGKLRDINEEGGCYKKSKTSQESESANLYIKQILEIFHNNGGTKDKLSEANPNLGRSCQDMEEMLSSYSKFLDQKTSTPQILLDKYFAKK